VLSTRLTKPFATRRSTAMLIECQVDCESNADRPRVSARTIFWLSETSTGKLNRRSLDVHFPRYRAESASERQVFINMLQSFAHHMPLAEPPDLAANWELLYERSVGCVGILKQRLMRALYSVLRCGGKTIARKDLEAQAPIRVAMPENSLRNGGGRGAVGRTSRVAAGASVSPGTPGRCRPQEPRRNKQTYSRTEEQAAARSAPATTRPDRSSRQCPTLILGI
jgi:hypothetical protein